MRGKLILAALGFAILATQGEPQIVEFTNNGTLKWTNSVPNATYRIDASQLVTKDWTNVGVVTASQNTGTFPLPATGQPTQFYRVIWLDAPAARPVGDWIYSGYEQDRLTVTGLVSFAESNPLVGSADFKAVATNIKHPTGVATFNNSRSSNTNAITIFSTAAFGRSFVEIRGQMTGDEFYGTWTVVDARVVIGGGAPTPIISGGRFSARRK
jgi:hypothetical protein